MTPRACPFCRTYVADAGVARCETCDVPLVSARSLGPSPEERLAWESLPVEERPIRTSPFSHGRGWLTGAAILGVVAYLLPWLEVHAGNAWRMQGADFGRKLTWPHACLAAWIVVVPTATTRRTVGRLLAARPILGILAALPTVVVAVLRAHPPTHKLLQVETRWLVGSWLEVLASITAVVAVSRLGRGGPPAR